MAADEDDDVDDDGEDGDFSDASTPDSKARVAASMTAHVGSIIVDLVGADSWKGRCMVQRRASKAVRDGETEWYLLQIKQVRSAGGKLPKMYSSATRSSNALHYPTSVCRQ